MNILMDKVRVFGFRGLKNVEVSLEQLTVITGMNNTGKTSFLKALQLVFGNRQIITTEDFYIYENSKSEEIIIDIRIISVDKNNNRLPEFSEEWTDTLKEDKIRTDISTKEFIAIRTIVSLDQLKNTPKTKQFILQEWSDFKINDANYWYQIENGKEKSFHMDEIPFFFMDAQRDIIEDLKMRTSYLGKMLSKIEYKNEDIILIEEQIKKLNEKTVSSSDILSRIENTLKDLDSAMDNENNGVAITPFPKKVRDLNKGVTIQYADFSMDYHGMGTRSWSSLLTLKSFILQISQNFKDEVKPFFPILAIEEPEAHLHPNAQKKLFSQISGIEGQKIVSTHSSYIAGSAELHQIRSFYKNEDNVLSGKINIENFTSEDIRKIKRQVINSKGELFFSKLIVFCEGETEEQALPIFAEKYFRNNHYELGIDFVGVGGFRNYKPFMRFAESLKIPWIIFSDAENTEDKQVKKSVQEQFEELDNGKREEDSIVFLDENNDFEKQMILDGYQNEIKQLIIDTTIFHNDYHKSQKVTEIGRYDDNKLYSILKGSKTKFGPAIADAIVKTEKTLPPKVITLFEKINTTLRCGE